MDAKSKEKLGSHSLLWYIYAIKLNHMTDKQAAIFRRVLDTNWEIKEIQESGRWVELAGKEIGRAHV